MKTTINRRFAQEILSYLIADDERLLYIGKPARVILIPRFFIIAFTGVITYALIHYLALVLFSNTLVFILSTSLLILFAPTAAFIAVFDWLFDFYIVTNKKIIDVHFAPPMSHNLSTILLDQVRCTEVDTQKNGFIHEFLDIGDVTITFDRPTSKQYFTLHNINHPEPVSLYLGHALAAIHSDQDVQPFWYRSQAIDHHLQIGEDIALMSGKLPHPSLN